jgi:type II secretory pathway pseudopilin PulG
LRRAGGYTLLEILISVGILVMLGAGLATIMTQGISIWKRAENRGRVYEQARMLLDQIAEDLRSTVAVAAGEQDSAWVRFICDHDENGRQRLRFVRTTSGETGDPILREGGQYLSVKTPAIYDGLHDNFEARAGLLAAPGGLMEIFYGRDPRSDRATLWRGVRAPLGGSGSFFDDDNVESSLADDDDRKKGDDDSKKNDDSFDEFEEGGPFAAITRPLTDGVLYLGLNFWGPTTNTWDESEIPRARVTRDSASGPLLHWDSTRALLDYPGENGEFTFKAREGSLTDTGDDIFPERVEVTIVLRDDDHESLFLVSSINQSAKTFTISRDVSVPDDESDRFILVDDEWIAVDVVDGRTIMIARDGRGMRDSDATSHKAGARVDIGATFRRVIDLPGSRRGRGDTGSPKTKTGRKRS